MTLCLQIVFFLLSNHLQHKIMSGIRKWILTKFKRRCVNLCDKNDIILLSEKEKVSVRQIAKKYDVGKTQVANVFKNKSVIIEESQKWEQIREKNISKDWRCAYWPKCICIDAPHEGKKHANIRSHDSREGCVRIQSFDGFTFFHFTSDNYDGCFICVSSYCFYQIFSYNFYSNL